MTSIRYNQVRQKGSHNSYQRTEGYPDQALYWRIRSLEVDIHNGNDASGWPALIGDWYVYHMAVVDQTSNVNKLSDALDVLRAFHLAVPDHEVMTIWLDLKDSFTTSGDHTPEALDQLLVSKLSRDLIWGPPDLIGTSINLQAAIAANGWPSLESVRGKFIFACTTGDLSSSDSHLNQYVDNGKTANQRLAFVAPEIVSTTQIAQFNYAVIFNLDSSHTSLGADVYKQGYISRSYGLDSQKSWCNGWKSSVNHLVTNKVNALEDEWARTDVPASGYPFNLIDAPTRDDLVEPGALYAINVNSGDIWGNRDSCYFQYDSASSSLGGVHTAFVGNPRSHVNGWIKAGMMARTSIADNASYVAILRTGANGVRLQYRSQTGASSAAIEAVIPKGGNKQCLVDENTPIWIRLDIRSDGKSATGYYSIDGVTWIVVGTGETDSTMQLQGWVASSHSSGSVKWLFGGSSAPQYGVALGPNSTGQFIASSAAAASLGAKPDSACCSE